MSQRTCALVGCSLWLLFACSSSEDDGTGGASGPGNASSGTGAAGGSGATGGGSSRGGQGGAASGGAPSGGVGPGGAGTGGIGGNADTGGTGGMGVGGGGSPDGWITQFPGALFAYGKVATDASGNIAAIAAGEDADFGNGPTGKVWHVVKLSPDGVLVWSRSFDVYPDAVAFDPAGNLDIVGTMNGVNDLGTGPIGVAGQNAAFVLELDPSGAASWAKAFPVTYPDLWTTAVDSTGAIYIGGKLDGTLGGTTLPAASYAGFIAKLDGSTGAYQWGKLVDTFDAHIFSIAIGPNDKVTVAGSYYGQPTGWDLPVYGYAAFLAQLDSSGSLNWSLGFEGLAAQAELQSVCVDSAGNVSAGGVFPFAINVGGTWVTETDGTSLLVRVDSSGTLQWHQVWQNEYAYAPGVACTPAGGTEVSNTLFGASTIGGQSVTPLAGGDVLLAAFAADGTLQSAQVHGDVLGQSAEFLTLDPWGRRIFSGTNSGSLDLGFGSIEVANGDFFVAKMPK